MDKILCTSRVFVTRAELVNMHKIVTTSTRVTKTVFDL